VDQLASTKFSYTNLKSANRRTSQNKWITLTYFIRIKKTEPIKSKNLKSLDYLNGRYHDLVMLYLVGKLFSKLEHIKILALCDYFKVFIAENKTGR